MGLYGVDTLYHGPSASVGILVTKVLILMIKEDDDTPMLDDLGLVADIRTSKVGDKEDAKFLQKKTLYALNDVSDASTRDENITDKEPCRYSTEGADRPIEDTQVQHSRTTAKPCIENRFLELSTDQNDGELSHYQIVGKSIHKPRRTGFLNRITGGTLIASTKQKYALGDITEIIATDKLEKTNLAIPADEEKKANSASGEQCKDVNLLTGEEEDIEVSIDRSTIIRGRSGREYRHFAAEDGEMSEVVIHSGDGESGFATLNPVIGINVQSHGVFVAPASSGVSGLRTRPVLLEIPIAEQTHTDRERHMLIINVLGATGLFKAEKFGTQSCFLEMRLFDGSSVQSSLSSPTWASNMMRTELHKKGGSEAQWNQQFTTLLHSKEVQLLHVRVKTGSKILVGETNISLDKVGDLFYDQHYTLFRNDESSDDLGLIAAGQVHLQLKILDTLTMPTLGIPPLQLPGAPSQQHSRLSLTKLTSIPAVLLNGGLFYKIPFHTRNIIGRLTEPRRQWVVVRRVEDPPHLQITWGDPTLSGFTERKNLRSFDLAQVTEIREGHTTAAFMAQSESNVVKEKEKCFSLVTRARTLDLVAASKEEAHIWVDSLCELIFATKPSNDASLTSARTIESYKQSALVSQERGIVAGEKPIAAAPPNKRMVAVWRNRIFNLARHDRIDDIVECLRDGCPIDLLEGGTGDTLLMLACRQGNAELVELCLSWRAKNDPHPEFGETALQVAVNSSQAHCVGLLLSTAAKSDMDSEIVNHIDPNNDAPLHVAARHGDLACLQLLLHHGADICVVEEFGRTPLHCAVANGSLECVAYLLDVGGDSVLNSGDQDGDTALHYAAQSGNETIVKLLLESAANVYAYNVQNESAYDVAVREHQQLCANLILNYCSASEKDNCASAFRNDAASTLLERTAAYNHTEFWDTAVQHKGVQYEQDKYEMHAALHRSSTFAPHESTISRLPLSPSERVRDALTKRHHANLLSPQKQTQVWSANSYDFVRNPINDAYHLYNERLIAPEQPINNHFRPYKRYSFRSDPQYSPRRSLQYHQQESFYRPQYDMQTGALNCVQPSQAYPGDIPVIDVPINPILDHGNSSPYLCHIPCFQGDTHWDTLYTEDGYAYYVNKLTNVSQWENPFKITPCDGYTIQETQSESRKDVLAPDAIIRLRLAEARKQKSLPAIVSPINSPTISCSTPFVETQPPASINLTKEIFFDRQATGEEWQQSSSKSVKSLSSESEMRLTPISAELVIAQEQQPLSCFKPSKYEARTGLKLLIDTAAPLAQDGSRPVFVPSPRSRSPVKKLLKETNDGGISSSFEKSRASSPRGRSRNIQLIEPKRANNLALALASFKIHDQYEQIVNDIVTMDERLVNPALLGCLQRFFPTEKEKQALQSFKGSIKTLGKAEHFFCLLFQIPGMQERIDMFLYKMEFDRVNTTLLTRILIVKRACRDLVENFSLIQALERFFEKQSLTSFPIFEKNKAIFKSKFLPKADEKLRSFRGDLEKAMGVEPVDLQLQLNRLMTGIRLIQSFVNGSPSSCLIPFEKRDGKARDILQRFLMETRPQLAEVESEFESMETWGDKLLAVFGESKATCQISAIMQAVVELL